MPEQLRARIQRHEGLRLRVYEDSLGCASIGYGHLIRPSESFTVITKQEAEHLLDQDLQEARDGMERAFPWYKNLAFDARDILIEMIFQLGVSGVRKFTRFLDALQRRDYQRASDEMLNSRWADQTPERAHELASLLAAIPPANNVLAFVKPTVTTSA
jgi:lysozyme